MTNESVSFDQAIARAAEIGAEHGENAAAWWEQETRVFLSSPPNVAMMLQGIEDGDPMVLDNLPSADLSGEWADGYTPRQLLHDVGGNDGDASFFDDLVSDLCDAYENAFSEAVERAVTDACHRVLQ